MAQETSKTKKDPPPRKWPLRFFPFPSHGLIHLLGALSAGAYCSLSLQSRGLDPVSLAHFFTCIATAWAALLVAFLLTRQPLTRSALISILAWAFLFRVIGILANPSLAEDDYFRFLWDGYRFAETGDPYQEVPADFIDNDDLPDAAASLVYNINYPELPTIYGPVMELVFLASYQLAPASLIVLKCLFVLFEGLLLFLLSRLLSTRWLLVAAWCPLLVFETSFQAHPDVIGVSLMMAALWAAQRRSPWLAMLALALAVCSKPFAILLWPFIVQERKWLPQGLLLAAIVTIVYSPFLLQQSNAGATSIGAMATRWEFNPAGYALFKYLFGEQARFASLAAVIASYLFLLVRFWHQRNKELDRDSEQPLLRPPLDFVYAALFFFSPVINPWYLLWLFPFVMLQPRPWSLIALAVVSLSYATGLNLADRSLEEFEVHPLAQALQWGLITASIGYGIYSRIHSRRIYSKKHATQ